MKQLNTQQYTNVKIWNTEDEIH